MIRGFNDISDDNLKSLVNIKPSERHIIPAGVSPRFAEIHGMLDNHSGLQKEAYEILISKQGSIYDEREGVEIITRNENGKELVFPVHNTPLVKINYLPDPYCKGVVFAELPGAELGKEVIFSNDETKMNEYPIDHPNHSGISFDSVWQYKQDETVTPSGLNLKVDLTTASSPDPSQF